MATDRRQFLSMLTAGSLMPTAVAVRAAEDRSASLKILSAVEALGIAPTTIRLLAPSGCDPNLAPVIRQFEAATGHTIQLSMTPVDDINTRLLIDQFSDEAAHDLALVASFGIPDLAEADALRAVNDLEQRFPIARELRQQSLYQYSDSFGGKIYGPQFDGDLYLLFLNNTLLNDAALASSFRERYNKPFAPPPDWQTLDQMMRHVHAPESKRYGGLLFRTPRYIAWEFWARLHANGVLPFDDNMDAQINSLGGVAALEALIAASESQHPLSDQLGLVGNWQAFAEGQSLCHLGWGGSQKYFNKNNANLPNGVTVAQLPGIAGNPDVPAIPFFNWGWNFAVTRGARHAELAFLFAAFATAPEVSAQAVAEIDGFIDPFQPGHYEDPAIIDAYGRQFLDAHASGMRAAIPDYYLLGHREYEKVLSSNLLLANRRQISAAQAAESIDLAWDAITASLGRAEQRRQWQALKRKYPPGLIERMQTTRL